MAWSFTINWVHRSDVGSDSRQSAIQLNDAGTDYDSSTTFDYFPDTAVVGDYLTFKFVKRFWGIRLNVGTAFAATSVTFVWEYQTGSTTWSTLRVDNPNALLSTGVQEINFTPPDNWYCQREEGFGIRVRISALSGITEGGANTTDKVKWNMRELQCTGTESSMSSAVTANDSGTYTILPATTPATGLEPVEMSVARVRDIAKVDIVLSGSGAGAGDTIDITGEDLDGNSLTETIDVSAGDGTYTSTLAYHDITQIDCNGFSSGTITVTQKKWGAIEQVTDRTYALNAHLCVGDGSTATTLTLYVEALILQRGAFWYVEDNATFTCGTIVGADENEDAYSGCYIYETSGGGSTSLGIGLDVRRTIGANAVANLYGSMWMFYGGQYTGPLIRTPPTGGTLNVKHSMIRVSKVGGNARKIYDNKSAINFTDVRCNFDTQNISGSDYNFNETRVSNSSSNLNAEIGYNSFTYTDVAAIGSVKIWFYTGTGIGNFVNCSLTKDDFGVGWNGAGDGNEKIRISYTFDLKVIDENGNGIENATVKIVDGEGTTVGTLTTDANGEIAQQTLIAHSGSYVKYDPAITWVDKENYTITITKSGYKKRVIKYTMDRKREEVEVLEKTKILNLSSSVKMFE